MCRIYSSLSVKGEKAEAQSNSNFPRVRSERRTQVWCHVGFAKPIIFRAVLMWSRTFYEVWIRSVLGIWTWLAATVCVLRGWEGLGTRRELLGAALAHLLRVHAVLCTEIVHVGFAGYLSGFRALGQGSGFVQPRENRGFGKVTSHFREWRETPRSHDFHSRAWSCKDTA